MMTMREVFLQNHWPKYPPAPDSCRSITRFMADATASNLNLPLWVGGLLFNDGFDNLIRGEFYLVGQGRTIAVRPRSIPPLMDVDKKPWPAEKILRSGDHIMVKVCGCEQDSGGEIVINSIEAVVLATAQLSEPLSTNLSVSKARLWQKFLGTIREYFRQNDCVEVFTPSLVECPGMEPALEPMATVFELNGQKRELFLPTSPELHLKKLLSMGWTDIFEIRSCFRNGEISDHHQPEFWMLEWYRAFSRLDQIKDDFRSLMRELACQELIAGEIGEIQEKTVQELFAEYADFKLTENTSKDELLTCLHKHGIPPGDASDWDDLFHLLFLVKIEPHLGIHGPLIVSGYPARQAALARVNDGWAERFEIYWRGFELANAFHELNDPVEQRQRFENDILERQKRNRRAVPIDEEFMTALSAGMPPASGIALGLERLFLACQNMYGLDEIRAFSMKAHDE